MFDVLGVKLTDEQREAFKEGINLAKDSINNVLNDQIAASEQRINSIDEQLAAKKAEIDTELQLQKAGLANNLAVKRQEQASLEAERQKELRQQRAAQQIQLAINASIQASELTVASAKIFKSFASLPLVGQILAVAQIGAMLLAFGSTVKKIATLPKFHDGDEVTHETARRRLSTGNRRSDEIDARLQVGEGLIRKESYQPNKKLLGAINKLGRRATENDLRDFMLKTPIGIHPDRQAETQVFINQAAEQKTVVDTGLHNRIDLLNDKVERLIDVTAKQNRVTHLPDGRVRIEDEKGNVRITRYS